MTSSYFNFSSYIATNSLERRIFVTKWWRIYAEDPRWVPPYYPMLCKELALNQSSFLSQKAPIFFSVEALRKKKQSTQPIQPPFSPATIFSDPLFEVPVAATVAIQSTRQGDRIAYLALMRCANDLEALARLLDKLFEMLMEMGCRKVIGPTGISPHLGSGVLQDSWDQIPPLYTPYNPPYLPELVASLFDPMISYRLYHLKVPTDISPEHIRSEYRNMRIVSLEPNRLPKDFHLLFAETCNQNNAIAPPDACEVAFLLHWLGEWPLTGCLAQVDSHPIGFILMRPDISPTMLKAKGGRNPLWRVWLRWNSRQPAIHGRVLFGGVLREWRNKGICRKLLQQALLIAREMNLQTLRIGPTLCNTSASSFLEDHGAVPRQTYTLYRREI